jgi:hypothetical protein
MKIKTRTIYSSHRLWPPAAHRTFNWRNISFANHVKYIRVIYDKRITWTLHTEMINAKAFRKYIYSLFKSAGDARQRKDKEGQLNSSQDYDRSSDLSCCSSI